MELAGLLSSRFILNRYMGAIILAILPGQPAFPGLGQPLSQLQELGRVNLDRHSPPQEAQPREPQLKDWQMGTEDWQGLLNTGLLLDRQGMEQGNVGR